MERMARRVQKGPPILGFGRQVTPEHLTARHHPQLLPCMKSERGMRLRLRVVDYLLPNNCLVAER